MSWSLDPDLERLIARAVVTRRDAMVDRQRRRKEVLDASLASRGVFQGGMRLAGHQQIDSDALDEFAQGAIDDALAILREIFGRVPVDATPWIRSKLTECFEKSAQGIVGSSRDLARAAGMSWEPDSASALLKARRRLDVELTRIELKARLEELTPPQRKLSGGHGADAFISHASEDKEEVARPIAIALHERGYSVWLDETVLKVGDRLLDKIDEGLANCRFGVVILSESFFRKKWTRRELAGLVAREDAEERTVILPVWCDVDEKTISRHLPSLAGVLAARTSDGLDSVVEQIVHAIGEPVTEPEV